MCTIYSVGQHSVMAERGETNQTTSPHQVVFAAEHLQMSMVIVHEVALPAVAALIKPVA